MHARVLFIIPTMLFLFILSVVVPVSSHALLDSSPSVTDEEETVVLPESEEKVDDWQFGSVVYEEPVPVPQPVPVSLSESEGKIDDWQFDPAAYEKSMPVPQSASVSLSARSAGIGSSSLGLSVGGSKDINNFRENIANDFLPLPTDITYEGLFYDYLFDIGAGESCQELFCPSYISAVSPDPFSGKDEYYLSVGLNSSIAQEDFARKKLNLLVVLDISGSMSSPFDRYYYDRLGIRGPWEGEDFSEKTKMKVAVESVAALLDHLQPEDRFSVVLFDDRAYLAKPFRKVGETDMEAIRGHILALRPRGGTNMSMGMEEATRQFGEYIAADSGTYENRIIFITDAQPNLGDVSEKGLLGMVKENAEDSVHTTFIGVGVDFNTELIEGISGARGANYYSVHTPSEFKKQLDDNFDYMVTPLVFDLRLTLDAPGFVIKEVYGSPEADEATGEVLYVNTLFPSEQTDGEVRGGLVLVQMQRVSDDAVIRLTADYRDRSGSAKSSTAVVTLDHSSGFYGTTGVHKGILLSRYATLLKNWTIAERESFPVDTCPIPIPPVWYYYSIGIPPVILPPYLPLGTWERQSVPLRVSREYRKLFAKFARHFASEMKVIGDSGLERELTILERLSSSEL